MTINIKNKPVNSTLTYINATYIKNTIKNMYSRYMAITGISIEKMKEETQYYLSNLKENNFIKEDFKIICTHTDIFNFFEYINMNGINNAIEKFKKEEHPKIKYFLEQFNIRNNDEVLNELIDYIIELKLTGKEETEKIKEGEVKIDIIITPASYAENIKINI